MVFRVVIKGKSPRGKHKKCARGAWRRAPAAWQEAGGCAPRGELYPSRLRPSWPSAPGGLYPSEQGGRAAAERRDPSRLGPVPRTRSYTAARLGEESLEAPNRGGGGVCSDRGSFGAVCTSASPLPYVYRMKVDCHRPGRTAKAARCREACAVSPGRASHGGTRGDGTEDTTPLDRVACASPYYFLGANLKGKPCIRARLFTSLHKRSDLRQCSPHETLGCRAGS